MHETTVRIRVLYADVDQMGVVHHANYFRFFEHARTEFLRRRGLSYAAVEASGVMMPIVDVALRYHAPARYDDLLEVRAMLTETRQVSVVFEYEVRRADAPVLLARGTTKLACCNRESGRVVALPVAVQTALARAESPE